MPGRLARALVFDRALGETVNKPEFARLMIELAKRFPDTVIGVVVVGYDRETGDVGSMHVGASPPATSIAELFRIAADGCDDTPPHMAVDGLGILPYPPNENVN